jgi:hypothetical protein
MQRHEVIRILREDLSIKLLGGRDVFVAMVLHRAIHPFLEGRTVKRHSPAVITQGVGREDGCG